MLSNPAVLDRLGRSCGFRTVDLTNWDGAPAARAKHYGVDGVPTLILVDSRGRELSRYQGPHDPQYFGRWIDAAAAAAAPFSSAGLAPIGASVGAGLIAALPANACGLTETARVARYLADQSAGQCGPCLSASTLSLGKSSGSPKAARPTWRCCSAGSARSTGAGPAAIPTAPSGSSAAP